MHIYFICDRLNDALKVAFASGGVMGLMVVCSGVLGLSFLYLIWGGLTSEDTAYLAGFGFGGAFFRHFFFVFFYILPSKRTKWGCQHINLTFFFL